MSQFYAVLGLEDGATQEEVQNAYRQLAKTYHPDTCQNPALQKILTEKFKEISNAYSQLKALGWKEEPRLKTIYFGDTKAGDVGNILVGKSFGIHL